MLLSEAGEPLSKQRLMEAAWGQRVVEHSNLTVQIAALRRVLGSYRDDPGGERPFIRTVPGFGYAFAAPVQRDGPGRPADSLEQGSAAPPGLAASGWVTEPLTHFIGREKERRALALLLSGNRLVTLTGMGGVGKTRLAMRLWRELAPDYADGITLVDLAPLAEVHQVDEAVAAALGVGGGEMSAEAGVVSRLQGRRMLLIIDNAEHLNAAVARLLGRVLASCPLVSALVTSRDGLGLPGETVFRLSPLDVPPEASGQRTAGQAMAFNSVRLLVDRAQALFPGFELDDEAAQVAAAICRRLDGIALAIEMAVPRLEVLSLPQLAERVNDRFGGLAPPRHDVLPPATDAADDVRLELGTADARGTAAAAIAGDFCGRNDAGRLGGAGFGRSTCGDPGRDGRLLEQLTRLAQGSFGGRDPAGTGPGYGAAVPAAGDGQGNMHSSNCGPTSAPT